MNLYEVYRRGFEGSLDRCFIDAAGHSLLTYGRVDDASARLSTVLRRLGLGKGDRLAIRAEKTPATLVLWLACLRTGAVFVSLTARAPDAEALRILADLYASLLVVDSPVHHCPSGLRQLPLRGSGSLLEQAATAARSASVEGTLAQDSAMILYTSG